MSYTHLSSHERSVIEHLHRQGVSASQIAAQLGRSRSTIGRELGRNTPTARHRYLARRADGLATQRRASANGLRAKLRGRPLREVVVKRLRLGWSPKVIAGRFQREHPRDDAVHLSGMTIYRWLQRDAQAGGTLTRHLPRRGRGRKPNGSRQKRAPAPAPGKRRITQHPPGADHRSRFGHGEIDTLEGRHKASYLVSLVDRKSRYTLLGKAKDKRADTIHNATVGRPFKPGQSGNPTGRPAGVTYPGDWIRGLSGCTEAELRLIADGDAEPIGRRFAARMLLDTIDPTPEVRGRAAIRVMDRTEGKPGVTVTVDTTSNVRRSADIKAEMAELIHDNLDLLEGITDPRTGKPLLSPPPADDTDNRAGTGSHGL